MPRKNLSPITKKSDVEMYRLGVTIARLVLDGMSWKNVGLETGLSRTGARFGGARIFHLAVGARASYRTPFDIDSARKNRATWTPRIDFVSKMLDGMTVETADEITDAIIEAVSANGPAKSPDKRKEMVLSDIKIARAAVNGVGYEQIAKELHVSSSTVGSAVRRVIVLAAKAAPNAEIPDINEAQTMPELWLPRFDQIERFLEQSCGV